MPNRKLMNKMVFIENQEKEFIWMQLVHRNK